MMHTIAMLVQYDGSGYHGWQRQLNGKSLQETIEKPLSRLLKQKISLTASGRTDARVHALAQCASFQCDLIIPIEKLKFALSTQLPSDIVMLAMWIADDSFHARYDATEKTYLYKLYFATTSDPFRNKYSLYVPTALDEIAIKEAMQLFLGKHDFRGFMATGSSVRNTVRTIYQFELSHCLDEWHFEITGDGFLYNMVRIIIGLLIEVGKGKIDPEAITGIIESRDRTKAKWTAPPQGLYLKKVKYENDKTTVDKHV